MEKMNKLYNYPAIFYKEDDGRFSVIFPDLNHLATYGVDLDDSIRMAMDCLAGEIPVASNIQNIDDNVIKNELEELYTDKSRVFVNIISVNVAEYAEKHFNKSVKKLVTIPQWMADMAEAKKLKLSKLLQDAIREKIQSA